MDATVGQSLPKGKGQCARILKLLLEAKGQWVPLYQILALQPRIAEPNTRIFDLRHKYKFNIINKNERGADGVVHSWYRLEFSPVQAPAPPETAGTLMDKGDSH